MCLQLPTSTNTNHNQYSRSYYRAAWIATGLDAGFATSMNIRPKWLRDFSSVVFSLYYILSSSKAEEKVRRSHRQTYGFHLKPSIQLRKFRAVCTVEMLRATWVREHSTHV